MADRVSGRGLVLATIVLVLALVLASEAGAAKRYRDQVFDQIKTKTDLVYGSAPVDGAAQDLELDLFRPKGDRVGKRPALVWVHGGGFAGGDKSYGPSAELAREYAQMGYVTVSINYRLLVADGCSGASGIPPECYAAAIEATHDAQAAVRWLRANAKGYRIDRKRIGIGGESAGAIISCGVGVLSSSPGTSGNPGPPSSVGAFVSISGGLPGALFVDQNTSPGILFASLEDPVVPYQWSVDTQAKLESLGIPTGLTAFPGAVHVPFAEHGTEIEDQSTRFLYKQLELRDART
jgi:dienelactone hydrolase